MADTRNAVFAATLVDVLHRLGVEHACVTPGSRNTPLSIALAESPIDDWSHHDERSSSFFALGIARTTGRPVLIVTTSGTAAAELHPALAEAREGRVPLIAITADRPRELVGVGAPQTIDQSGLFGRSVKWAHDSAVPDPVSPDEVVALARRLFGEAMDAPMGPVHLDLRFQEPLFTPERVVPLETTVERIEPGPVTPVTKEVAEVADLIEGRRGLLIAGPHHEPVADQAVAFAAALDWPILADPLSGLRAGSHDRSHVVGASDALCWAGHLDRTSPDVVVRFGAIPTSKPLWQWLGAHPEIPQVFIEPAGWRDPGGSASHPLRSDPAATLDRLTQAVSAPASASWMDSWRQADQTASKAVESVVSAAPFPNEPAVLRTVVDSMTEPGNLWVASSMPVRDLDAVMPASSRQVRPMANRGANGIDGFVSTALGSVAASGLPTVAVAGDLSMLHDLNALATAARLGIPLTIVVVNNDGGGIFHMLPQAGHEHFERHFGTPHGLDFVPIARAMGVAAHEVSKRADLADRVSSAPAGPVLLQVTTDRDENAALHREIREAVRKALGAGG